MTVTQTRILVAVAAVLIALFTGVALSHNTPPAVPTAALRAADNFAADYASPNGIDADNAIGNYATPEETAIITKALQNGDRSAGFTVTGPAVAHNTNFANVVIPTTGGPWHIKVVNYNGRWLVAQT